VQLYLLTVSTVGFHDLSFEVKCRVLVRRIGIVNQVGNVLVRVSAGLSMSWPDAI